MDKAQWPWNPLIEPVSLLSWQVSWIHAANFVCSWEKQTHRPRGTSSSPCSWFPWTLPESKSSGLCRCLGWRILQVRPPKTTPPECGSSLWAAVWGSPCSVQNLPHAKEQMTLVRHGTAFYFLRSMTRPKDCLWVFMLAFSLLILADKQEEKSKQRCQGSILLALSCLYKLRPQWSPSSLMRGVPHGQHSHPHLCHLQRTEALFLIQGL